MLELMICSHVSVEMAGSMVFVDVVANMSNKRLLQGIDSFFGPSVEKRICKIRWNECWIKTSGRETGKQIEF